MNPREYTRCDWCNGSGSVYDTDPQTGLQDFRVICPACEGEGYVGDEEPDESAPAGGGL